MNLIHFLRFVNQKVKTFRLSSSMFQTRKGLLIDLIFFFFDFYITIIYMEYGTVPMIQASFRGFFYFVFAMLKKKRENTANVDKILGEIVVKIIKLETGKK